MIITKTPFRMSFFGGGSDIEQFFKEEKGSVISTTFDKYVYVTVRHLPPFFEYSTELKYGQTERVKDVDDIEHPLIRNAMKMLNMHELYVAYDADLPSRTGLGTSSTFAVGLLNAFYCLKGKYRSKKDLANDAIHLERVLCNEDGGWQDQIAAAFGGLNRIDFDYKGYHVNPIIISSSRKEQLNDNLMLFFTGFTRFSSEIQKGTKTSIAEKKEYFKEMVSLVDRAQEILENPELDLDDFGRLLNKEWELKRSTNKQISNEALDGIYKKAISAGALGGKLLGAGGGGFFLFYVDKEHRESVRQSLGLLEIPFKFERHGTRVIYYTPENFVLEKQG